MATQHAGLTPERWAGYPRSQQILMIANEMNRAGKLLGGEDRERLRGCYERILALANLTIQVTESRSFRREMLRWRDLVAERYIAQQADVRAQGALFRALLQFHPEAWKQLPYVTGAAQF